MYHLLWYNIGFKMELQWLIDLVKATIQPGINLVDHAVFYNYGSLRQGKCDWVKHANIAY